MEAMHNAPQSDKEHLSKTEEAATRSRSSGSKASSAGPPAPVVKSDDDLFHLLGGFSGSPEDKKRKVEMLEAVASRFRT
eukprot:7464011-Pyramimonas_sp.AAC.1